MDADVAIVGGGPAGCAAALALAAEKLSVAVVDAGTRLAKPTETAAPHLRRLLVDLGVQHALAACEPCLGIAARWGRRLAFQPGMLSPFGHGWFVHRARFDRSLQQAARGAGIVWLSARAAHIDFHPPGASVELTNGETLRARWLVLATGSPSWPAKLTAQERLNLDPMLAFWCALPGPLDERLIHVEASEHGWWYLCPGENGVTFACFMTDLESARTFKPLRAGRWRVLFESTELSRLAGKPSPVAVKAMPTGVAALRSPSGRNWTAVGDAAIRLDPIGSSGLCSALEGGRRAGAAIAAALQGKEAALDGYRRWAAGLLKDFMRQRSAHYAVEAGLRGSAFWRARLRAAA